MAQAVKYRLAFVGDSIQVYVLRNFVNGGKSVWRFFYVQSQISRQSLFDTVPFLVAELRGKLQSGFTNGSFFFKKQIAHSGFCWNFPDQIINGVKKMIFGFVFLNFLLCAETPAKAHQSASKPTSNSEESGVSIVQLCWIFSGPVIAPFIGYWLGKRKAQKMPPCPLILQRPKDYVESMKKKPVKSTNGPAFFKLLRSAARPQSKPIEQKEASHSGGDYAGKKTRSNTSERAGGKHDDKSHEPTA
jgi:hypothetical protein